MRNKFLTIMLVLICTMLFFGCNSSSGKVEQASSTEEPTTNQTQSPSDDKADSGFDLMAKEKSYILENSILSDDVIKLFGEPQKKSELAVWDADGLEHQSWYYESKGIELGFIKNDKNKLEVSSIKLQSPCNLKTSRGIGIGSTKAEVLKIYEQEIDKVENDIYPSKIVAGSVYGGLIFSMENDKVTSVFIGAAAE